MPTTYSQTITNPGAETGNTTGWTIITGLFHAQNDAPGAHGGSWYFAPGIGNTIDTYHQWYQRIHITNASAIDAIDHGRCNADLKSFHKSPPFLGTATNGGLTYIAYDDSLNVLDSFNNALTAPGVWTQEQILRYLPPTTRYIDIGCRNDHVSSTATSVWDDWTLDVVDTGVATLAAQAKDSQDVVYALSSQPAYYTAAEQVAVLLPSAAETSSGNYKVFSEQVVGYALVKGFGDKRKLRAWPFTQDDHDFYVLQLNDNTLVFDKSTHQWARWQSPGYSYWRGDDGCGWEGFNVCCDPRSGKVWKIDPTGRLDRDGTTITPITSKVVGMVTERFRNMVPCYMAELAVSEGKPPIGIDATTVGIQLLSSDDNITFYDHGTIPGVTTGENIDVRWYGLGLMQSTGRIFEIIDTGYARRIDGLNIEVGNR